MSSMAAIGTKKYRKLRMYRCAVHDVFHHDVRHTLRQGGDHASRADEEQLSLGHT